MRSVSRDRVEWSAERRKQCWRLAACVLRTAVGLCFRPSSGSRSRPLPFSREARAASWARALNRRQVRGSYCSGWQLCPLRKGILPRELEWRRHGGGGFWTSGPSWALLLCLHSGRAASVPTAPFKASLGRFSGAGVSSVAPPAPTHTHDGSGLLVSEPPESDAKVRPVRLEKRGSDTTGGGGLSLTETEDGGE